MRRGSSHDNGCDERDHAFDPAPACPARHLPGQDEQAPHLGDVLPPVRGGPDPPAGGGLHAGHGGRVAARGHEGEQGPGTRCQVGTVATVPTEHFSVLDLQIPPICDHNINTVFWPTRI